MADIVQSLLGFFLFLESVKNNFIPSDVFTCVKYEKGLSEESSVEMCETTLQEEVGVIGRNTPLPLP